MRTFTSDDVLSEPALEGIHSDGVDCTMVALLGQGNMTNESAITLAHDVREKVGTPIKGKAAIVLNGRLPPRPAWSA